MTGTLSSDQVNYLIWRYLQECGYKYSVFAFEHETKAQLFHEHYGRIRQGGLISLIQRGLQYRELELQINKARYLIDGTRKENPEIEPFFPPLGLTKAINNVSSTITSAGNGHMELDGDDDEKESSNTTTTQNHSRKHGREDGINGLSSGGEKSGVPEKKRRRKTAASLTPVASTSQPDGAKGDEVAVDSIAGSSPPVEEVRPVTNGCSVGIQVETTVVIPPKDAVILSSEHNRASVAWNPVNPTSLATATSGSLPRIWTVPHEPDGLQPYASRALDHVDIQQPEKVTAVEWSPKGDVLATASLDGTTHLWSVEGILLHTLDLRRVPILSLKWNSSAKFLIVFHCDEHLVLWNAATGDVVLDFERTNDSIYDVTWISDKWFACAKAEGAVTWDAETGRPMRLCVEVDERAHTLAWDEIGKRLAVGTTGGKIAIWQMSTQKTLEAKSTEKSLIWALSADQKPEHYFSAHPIGQETTFIQWQPVPQDSSQKQSDDWSLNKPSRHTRLLASCNPQERRIKIWSFDIASATAATTPTAPVHDISLGNLSISHMSFSPDGEYIVAAAYKTLLVFRVAAGHLAYAYDAKPDNSPKLVEGPPNGLEPVPLKHTNGDIEMGGMGDSDSGTGELEEHEVTSLSWERSGRKLAVAITGIGCVIIPISEKERMVLGQDTPPATSNGTPPDKVKPQVTGINDETAKPVSKS